MKKKLYADRDAIALGQLYADHVQAMTAEGLHEKSDIAAELAYRDAQIKALKEDLGQQYEMKVKAREQRDRATAKMKAAQAENLRIIRIFIGADECWQLVPVEPTLEMIAALGFAGDIDLVVGHAAISESIAETYKQALLVAPKKDIKND